METLYLLIPVSVVLVFFIGGAFWWSLRNGQFDDLEGPAYRVLMDDEKNDANEANEANDGANAPPAAAAPAAAESTPKPLPQQT
jgi:cbb3-type cytochrome oxidase maturation protein